MAFDEFKQRQAEVWSSAPFERIAPTLSAMHEAIVADLPGAPGRRWLDVGCGTGELVRLAARSGADVVGADLSPALIDTARLQAAEWGVHARFEVADCEALPYDEASFGLLSSSVGAIFAPDHQAAASELARVCASGGRLAMTAWVPDGEIADFFEVLAEFMPPPVPDAGDPMAWGDAAHAEELLGGAFELGFTRLNAPWHEESPEAMVEMFATGFGPVKTLLASISPERGADLRAKVAAEFAKYRSADGVTVDRVYLLISGTRR